MNKNWYEQPDIITGLATLRYYAERKQAANTSRQILVICDMIKNSLDRYEVLHENVRTMRKILIETNMFNTCKHYLQIHEHLL